MNYLVLSIIFTTILGIIFKLFPKYEIDEFEAITVNYYMCVLTAWVTIGEFPIDKSTLSEPFFFHGIILACFFLSGFTIVAITIKKYGIALATIMQKMSLVIPVSFALVYFLEPFTFLKITGISFAFISIILINLPNRSKTKTPFDPQLLILPVLTLLFSGIIETVLLYLSKTNLVKDGDPRFFALLFGFAGIMGTTILIYNYLVHKKKLKKKNIIAGLILGVPNFYSMYFLLKSLGLLNGGSKILPINNVAVIILTSFLAVFFFKEKLSKINLIGIFFAILSIIIIGNT